MKNRILHLFEWHLRDIIKNLDKIHEQGFTCIQISPLQPLKQKKTDWWVLYQPIAFEIGNELGTKEELAELCLRARDFNIRVIADVVCNHVAGKDTGEIVPHELVDKKLIYNEEYLKDTNPIWNWNDRFEVINHSISLPTLRLENYDLQDIIIAFLNELISVGVGGFRFDSAKNIALPNEGSDFWIRVLANLDRKDLFNYAEVIFENKDLIDKYCKYVNVLTDSFGSDKDKLVTFIESHDSYYEFKYTKNMTDEMLINEYRLLTQNYKNTLFYTRPFSDLWKSREVREINHG